jgi:hypothetical protein
MPNRQERGIGNVRREKVLVFSGYTRLRHLNPLSRRSSTVRSELCRWAARFEIPIPMTLRRASSRGIRLQRQNCLKVISELSGRSGNMGWGPRC